MRGTPAQNSPLLWGDCHEKLIQSASMAPGSNRRDWQATEDIEQKTSTQQTILDIDAEPVEGSSFITPAGVINTAIARQRSNSLALARVESVYLMPGKKPSGPHRVLTYLLYGLPPTIHCEDGYVVITSVRKLGKLLGTESKRINKWLLWLEDHGYIEHSIRSLNKHSVRVRMRRPPNVF